MWWHCGYRALPGVRASELARRFLRRHDAGSNRPSRLHGWYTYGTGTDGFVLVEVDTPRELAEVLSPYASVVEWRIEAIAELNYNQTLEELRRATQKAAVEELMAGIPPAEVVGAAGPSR